MTGENHDLEEKVKQGIQQAAAIALRAEKFTQRLTDNDIPGISSCFDQYVDWKDRIEETPTIRRFKKQFKDSGIPATLSSIDACLSDVGSNLSFLGGWYDVFSGVTGLNPLSKFGIDPQRKDSRGNKQGLEHVFQNLNIKSLKDYVFSPENKINALKTVAMPALSTILPLVGLSASVAPIVLGAAIAGYSMIKVAHYIHRNRRERQKKDIVDRSNDHTEGISQVLASGTPAVLSGHLSGAGVTSSGAWSRRSGTTRSQVFHDDATVKNLKLKISVFMHDIEKLMSEVIKLNDTISDIRAKCICLEGTTDIEEDLLIRYEESMDGVEGACNSLHSACQKLNEFKNTL